MALKADFATVVGKSLVINLLVWFSNQFSNENIDIAPARDYSFKVFSTNVFN